MNPLYNRDTIASLSALQRLLKLFYCSDSLIKPGIQRGISSLVAWFMNLWLSQSETIGFIVLPDQLKMTQIRQLDRFSKALVDVESNRWYDNNFFRSVCILGNRIGRGKLNGIGVRSSHPPSHPSSAASWLRFITNPHGVIEWVIESILIYSAPCFTPSLTGLRLGSHLASSRRER